MPDLLKLRFKPEDYALGSNEVHCWLANLEELAADLEAFSKVLAPEEQTRAARFHFEKDRKHFTVGRGLLRMLLGMYLRMTPEAISFACNEYGKPALANVKATLQFNMSHSHGLGLYGITHRCSVGVDIERIRANVAAEDLAKRFFAPTEIAELNSMPQELRRKAFFNGWARKEAFIKARGIGLSLGLDKFAVSLADRSPALLSIENGAPEQWTLSDCPAPEGFVAAVAVERPNSLIRYLG